jgi:hypothetical protein
MAHIKAPTRGVISRDHVAAFAAKRSADELLNLVDPSIVRGLETDGDAYVLEATADYTPQILAAHAQATLTGLVATGWLMPDERACFDVRVMKETKANPSKGIAYDPGAIAIVRNQPDAYRLAGRAADAARTALMSAARSVPSVTTNGYRVALAEAQVLERFSVSDDAKIDDAVSIEG